MREISAVESYVFEGETTRFPLGELAVVGSQFDRFDRLCRPYLVDVSADPSLVPIACVSRTFELYDLESLSSPEGRCIYTITPRYSRIQFEAKNPTGLEQVVFGIDCPNNPNKGLTHTAYWVGCNHIYGMTPPQFSANVALDTNGSWGRQKYRYEGDGEPSIHSEMLVSLGIEAMRGLSSLSNIRLSPISRKDMVDFGVLLKL